MASKARRAGSLATILNANTAAASNTLVIDSGGDISLSGSLTVSSGVVGYITNTDLQATFAQNTAITSLNADYLQVANADALYVTKSTALTSNNALVNLINDRYQVANASVKFVTKSVQLTSNNSLVNLINDRIQVANVSTTLGTYWPSANVIAYTDTVVTGSTKSVNSSIYIASGGENRVAIPYTNTNHMLVYLNGIQLVEGSDYEAANNAHIGNITPVLAEGDVLLVEEFKNHSSNTTNRSAGGGGGGYSFQGTVSGYTTAGTFAPPYTYTNIIDKFSLASDANATDVGDTTQPLTQSSNHKSSTHGYTSGGVSSTASPAIVNRIEKFSFSSDGNPTDSADLATSLFAHSGQSSSDNGYATAGSDPAQSPTKSTYIQKFPFASDTNATCIGSVFEAANNKGAGHSSSDNGYQSGGENPSFNYSATIQKFPFASDANATDVGDLTVCRRNTAGNSSSTNGYTHGGFGGAGAYQNVIDKFPFSSDSNATDVGDLTGGRSDVAGQSSTTSGYSSGGQSPQPTDHNNIEKYSFSSDGNATDVGDLTQVRRASGGTQV